MAVARFTAGSDEVISELQRHSILKDAPTYILRQTSVAIVSRNEALLLTNSDEVYVIGDNTWNQLCGDQPHVLGPAPFLNSALSNQRIKDLIPINGDADKFTEESQLIKSFVALTEDGRMLVWGHNATKLGGFKSLKPKKNSPMMESTKEVKWVKVVGRNGLMVGLTSCGKAFCFGETTQFENLTPDMGLVEAFLEPEEEVLDIGISAGFIFLTTSFCCAKFWFRITGLMPRYWEFDLDFNLYGEGDEPILKAYMSLNAADEEILVYTPEKGGKAFTLQFSSAPDGELPVEIERKILSVDAFAIKLGDQELDTYYSSCAMGFKKIITSEAEKTSTCSALKFLLESDEDKDVTLSVGPDQKIIKAHKCILKRCDYFKTFLAHHWDETADSSSKGHLQLPQFSYERCDSFVQFLYTDKLPDISAEDFEEYLNLADYFQCSDFRRALEVIVPSKISTENVISLYQSAELYHSQALQDECLAFAVKNGTSILLQADFKGLVSPSLLPLVACMQESLMSFVTKTMSDTKNKLTD